MTKYREDLKKRITFLLESNNLDTAVVYDSLRDEFNSIVEEFTTKNNFYQWVGNIKKALSLKTLKSNNSSTDISLSSEGEALDIKTLDELLAETRVDLSVWKVDTYTVNKWPQNSGEKGITQLFQVKANLKKIKPPIPTIKSVEFPRSVDYSNMITKNQSPIRKILIIADAQIGFHKIKEGVYKSFHSREALDIILQVVKNNHFDEIVINGDMLDFAEASRFVQMPEFAGTLQPSINEFGNFLTKLRDYSNGAKIVYLAGNHEARLKSRIIENFKFAYGLTAYGEDTPLLSLETILNLKKLRIEYIETYPNGKYWLSDDLQIVHGDLTKLTSQMKSSDTSVIMGHLHRIETQSRTVHNRSGSKQVSCHVMGCLCKIDGTVPGRGDPSWQQGFITVNLSNFTGHFDVNHHRIVNNQAIFNGVEYEGFDYFKNKLIPDLT